jgi:hypothetical protein
VHLGPEDNRLILCQVRIASGPEKQKLAQVDENEFERTHPRAFDPLP